MFVFRLGLVRSGPTPTLPPKQVILTLPPKQVILDGLEETMREHTTSLAKVPERIMATTDGKPSMLHALMARLTYCCLKPMLSSLGSNTSSAANTISGNASCALLIILRCVSPNARAAPRRGRYSIAYDRLHVCFLLVIGVCS